MIRKSLWLLSAGLMISIPAYAQEAQESPQPQPDSAPETTSASSQTGTGGEQTSGQQVVDGGDVIITANRRNQALSNVPIAVSAVTSENLENSGASDIRQLTQLSPSLLVSSTQSEAGGGVARIRGIGTVGDNPGLESSVGLFIDGVYRSRTGVGLTELGAVDRIEVLRGPQGTLFGRNTSAGLIHVITARPRFHTEVNGQLDIGNYDLRRLEAGVTGPLSSTIAGRLDAVFVRRDGFLHDVISGRDVNDQNRWVVRGQALFQPNEDLSLRLIADYAKRDEECCAAVYLPAADITASGPQPSVFAATIRGLGGTIIDDPSERDVSITPGRSYRSDVKDGGLSGELVYDFGLAELTSITAYRYNKYTRGQDADFNDLDILFRDDDGTAFNRFKTFTQELRVQGNSGPLDWLVGGYYANEKLRVRDNLAYGDDYLRYINCYAAIATPTLTFALDPTSDTCLSEPALAGAQAQLAAGIAAVQGAIALIQAAIADPGTPPEAIPGLQAQLAGYQAQLAQLVASATTLGVVNANPANPGFGSVANVLGLPGDNPFTGIAFDDTYNQTSNNFALFTHNIFKVNEQINLTVGLRYTHEKKKLRAALRGDNLFCRIIAASPLAGFQKPVCVLPGLPGGEFDDTDTKSENKVSGTAVLSYKPTPDLLTYLSYSRGYKAGGYNLDRQSLPRSGPGEDGPVLASATLDDLEFDPEMVDAVELGAKYNGRIVDVNVAIFHQLFDDFQLNLFNGISFQVENVNGCTDDLEGLDTDNLEDTGACTGKVRSGVRSRGVELELFARPMRDLSINFGTTFADTRYRKNLVGADGGATSPQLFQLPGRRISNSAKWTNTGSITWTPPLGTGGLKGLVYVDARHMSRYNTGSDLDIEKTQDAYTIVNGRIGVHGPDDMWGVELWARNMFNKNYVQVGFDAPLQGFNAARGVDQGFYPRSYQLFGAFLAEPRTFGLTLRGKLGFARAAPEVYVAPPAPPPPPPAVIEPAPPPPPPPPVERGERG